MSAFVADELSEVLKTKVVIGRINKGLLNRIIIDDVLLDDGCLPEDLLLHRMCPSISSVQRLGNKLMIKGDMWFHAI